MATVTETDLVFVDTSIDTHLAVEVSHFDTVLAFKRKIVSEHRKFFPATGDIKVESLKVKRRGVFYHLPDSVLVKKAFGAATRNWFFYVDLKTTPKRPN